MNQQNEWVDVEVRKFGYFGIIFEFVYLQCVSCLSLFLYLLSRVVWSGTVDIMLETNGKMYRYLSPYTS